MDFERGIIDSRLPDGLTRKRRAVVPMNRMARAALESAYAARLSDHVVEWAGTLVRSIRTEYSVAVRMLAAGQPVEAVEAVAQYLGHSNTTITHRTYARCMPEHLAGAAEILNFDTLKSTGSGSVNWRALRRYGVK